MKLINNNICDMYNIKMKTRLNWMAKCIYNNSLGLTIFVNSPFTVNDILQEDSCFDINRI